MLFKQRPHTRCLSTTWKTYFASNWKFIPNTPVRKVRGKKTVAKRDNTIYNEKKIWKKVYCRKNFLK